MNHEHLMQTAEGLAGCALHEISEDMGYEPCCTILAEHSLR